MHPPIIIDTFPKFLSYWTAAQSLPVDRQIDDWQTQYMSRYPELLEKQLASYAEDKLDWRQVARQKVFPFLGERLLAMRSAREKLPEISAAVYSRVQEVLGFESQVTFVIYVGIGCGAGWATTYRQSPAVLFGMENIAELGWDSAPTFRGLVAHELGHLVHDQWRRQGGKGTGEGSWWQLYSEGFAQRCEHIILGEDTWHESATLNDGEWLDWCRKNKKRLADQFLEMVAARDDPRPFFGSWYGIEGYKQCGYFLGHEIIKELEIGLDIREIALLDNIEERCRQILASW